jgi:hypothetical protein
VVTHTCNISYTGERVQNNCIHRPALEEKLMRPYLNKQAEHGWWCITVIPAMQEEDIGELQSQADWDQKRRPYLKTNKHNGLRYAWFK